MEIPVTTLQKQALLGGCALVIFVTAWLGWGRIRALLDILVEREATITTRPLSPTDSSGRDGGSASRHPARTPGRMIRGVVRPQEVDAWTLQFSTEQPASISVIGESNDSLDCVAQDAAGNLVDVDVAETGACHLRWVPARTGNYRIMIRNSGSAPSSYRLLTR